MNIENVFPCIAQIDSYVPVCKRFTKEEDGFMKGNTFVELGDIGNNVKIFGNRIATYGLAIAGCPQLTEDCLPRSVNTEVVCLLPRAQCALQCRM